VPLVRPVEDLVLATAMLEAVCMGPANSALKTAGILAVFAHARDQHGFGNDAAYEQWPAEPITIELINREFASERSKNLHRSTLAVR
jgi:hypothetical protein